MKILYDTDEYVVVHVVANADQDGEVRTSMGMPDHCFEIVDKTKNKEIFLRGAWASVFQRQIHDWQLKTPDQAEVDIVLQGFCELAQIPLLIQ